MDRESELSGIFNDLLMRDPNNEEMQYYKRYKYSVKKIKSFIINSSEYQKKTNISGYEKKTEISLVQKTNFGLNHSIKSVLDSFIKKRQDKPILLTVGRNLYPPNGGGENWLIDCCKFTSDDYFNIGLCYHSKEKTEVHDLNFCKVLKCHFDTKILLEIINYIKPSVVHNQDTLREALSEICSLKKIIFITGFNFWHDIIKITNDFFNVNMMKNDLQKSDNFSKIILNSNAYCASNFVNDVIEKVGGNKISVIESVSHHSYFMTKEVKNREYVSILNCHIIKGGQEFLYLLDNLDINIPLLGVITENFMGFEEKIIEGFRRRNERNDINRLYNEKIEDVKQIYSVSKIVLLPSIVDETFCRVAYECKINNIKTISYENGNLKYLLKDYENNTFLQNTVKSHEDIKPTEEKMIEWKEKVEEIYHEGDALRTKNMDGEEETLKIKNKFLSFIQNSEIKSSFRNRIGLLCPFVDQGLGIQCREYYSFLKKNNYEVAVFSFKPYCAKQTSPEEWDFQNVYYSPNTREEITFTEILRFCFKYRITKVIIPEICYEKIFNIIYWFKELGVEIITPINIETLRYNELEKYHLIDKICANNVSSYTILKKMLPDREIHLLEFDNTYMDKTTKKYNGEKIKFVTCGGLNSFFRKNLKEIYNIFNKIEEDFELTILIQDEKILELNNTGKINVIIQNKNYTELMDIIRDHHIFIHMGDHEGLGLGFYEALNNDLMLITLDTFPNKEFVQPGWNGYLIKNDYKDLEDNDCGVVNKAVVNMNDFERVINYVLDKKNRDNITKILNRNKWIKNNYHNNFINILKQ